MTNIKDVLLENQELKERILVLENELANIKAMGMFEFANKYCSDNEHEEAGRALARSLLGKPMTPEEVAIEEAEDCYVPYTAEDF